MTEYIRKDVLNSKLKVIVLQSPFCVCIISQSICKEAVKNLESQCSYINIRQNL
jgi:hypothetical protein